MSIRLVHSAKSGNIDALKELASAVLETENSAYLLRLLPVILDHLERNSPNLNADATPQILQTYLPILGDILDASSEWGLASDQSSRLVTLIDEKWESLRRWMSFIMEDLMESTPLGEKTEFVNIGSLYAFCADFFFSFSSHGVDADQFKVIKLIKRGRLSGFLDLITRIWLHGARTNHPLLPKMSLPFRSIAARMIHRIDPTPFSNVMLHNPDSVSVCLDNIFRAARHKKFDHVYTSLYILKLSLDWSQFDTQGKPVEDGPLVDLRHRFIANRSIVVVTSVLKQIASHPECFDDENWTDHETSILIWHCVSYISGCLRADGISFIVPALQNHLLQTTEKAWRMIRDIRRDPNADEEFKSGFTELFDTITMQLHRADVLRECRKWHRSASNPSQKNNVVSKRWKNLHSTVERRLEQRSRYKRTGRKICNNLECPAPGTAPIDLERCGDCCLAHYCSFECQKTHWPEHRKVCCSFTSNDTFPLAVRPLDNDFAKWLVVQDFEHLKDKLRTSIEVADISPNTPSSCYFFYDDFPPETEVFPGEMADEVPEGTILEQKTKNDLLIYAAFHEGKEERYVIAEWVTFTSGELAQEEVE